MPASKAEARTGLPSWAVVTPRREEHITRVTALLEAWAAVRGVGPEEAGRWRRAALLHDALRDASEDVLARYVALPEGWPPSLWHGVAAAAAAAADGETDAGVLDAVRYHSLGHAGWDEAGRLLYLADALEPGRRHARARLDAILARVPAATAPALRDVTELKLRWLALSGRRIPRETWEFWNSLVADDSSSSRF